MTEHAMIGAMIGTLEENRFLPLSFEFVERVF
jgi:hypothetical protein